MSADHKSERSVFIRLSDFDFALGEACLYTQLPGKDAMSKNKCGLSSKFVRVEDASRGHCLSRLSSAAMPASASDDCRLRFQPHFGVDMRGMPYTVEGEESDSQPEGPTGTGCLVG